MWTKTRSLMLSRILTTALTAVVLMLTFFIPYFADWYDGFSAAGGVFARYSVVVPCCVILYICEVFALAAMAALHVLLRNISDDKVFIEQNTKCLRMISWACMLAGAAFFVLGLWRAAMWVVAFCLIMFGLIMRVLKNVFEQAVEIKSENDYTI